VNVLITSFQRSHDLAYIPTFSVAVYQPKGFALPEVEWAKITDANGEWIRPRRFITEPDPLAAYHFALLDHYRGRTLAARDWLDHVNTFWGTIAFCCWCPYERRAREQLKEHGSFVCHTAVLGEFLEELGVRVWYDTDRQRMKVLP
jgi:hypothetical protein